MTGMEFNLEMCFKMAEAAKSAQDEIGVHVTIAIADTCGVLRFLHRFGNAILPSVEIAEKKAYTAATLGMSTSEFGKIAQPGGEAFGINSACSKLAIFGGGFPLTLNGKTVGGIGVSGASVAQDEAIAKKMLEAFGA